MSATPGVETSQDFVHAILDTSDAPADVAQARVMMIYNIPSAAVDGAQAGVNGVVQADDAADQLSQAMVLAIVRGRIDDYELRAWTFDLDGHSFYVLKLGRQGTVVFDLTTGQWTDWRSLDLGFWRAMTGMNWLGMGAITAGNAFGTNIVVGDDTHGLLWILDPTQGFDDHPRYPAEIVAIQRRAMGQLPMRGRNVAQCNGVYITGSLGRPAIAGAEIILSTSDDEGRNWHDHGAITVTPGDYNQEFSWRSIGQVRAPGRLFEIYDDGAMQRIDGLDMLPDGQ
jgi:hypothetical protein